MMTRQERAKQFAPFDAMKGLQEALRDREERHDRVPKRELSEDAKKSISDVLKRLCRGMKVDITYYGAFHEAHIKGFVTDVDLRRGCIGVNDTDIWIDDVYSIEITDYVSKTAQT